jgi:hypothetical protein
MNKNFSDFSAFFYPCYDTNLEKTSRILSKKRQLFVKFSGYNIFKIITSVLGRWKNGLLGSAGFWKQSSCLRLLTLFRNEWFLQPICNGLKSLSHVHYYFQVHSATLNFVCLLQDLQDARTPPHFFPPVSTGWFHSTQPVDSRRGDLYNFFKHLQNHHGSKPTLSNGLHKSSRPML